MKVLDSFIVDNVEEKITVKLLQCDTKFQFLIKHYYRIEHSKYPMQFFWIFYTKFFAKRTYNHIKNRCKSAWLEYGVYEVGGSDVK